MINQGISRSISKKNNKNNISQINWDARYDGKNANMSVDIFDNGEQKHYDIDLDNKDLANLLNVPTIQKPLHQRLEDDFISGKSLMPQVIQFDTVENFPSIVTTHRLLNKKTRKNKTKKYKKSKDRSKSKRRK